MGTERCAGSRELGPRDLEKNQALIKARDEEEKEAVELSVLISRIEEELVTMQTRLLDKARAFRENNSHTHVDTLAQLTTHIADSTENGEVPGWILQVGAETIPVKNK